MTTPGISSRNGLIIKIALFLNYLDPNNHTRLVNQLARHQDQCPDDIDVLKVMLAEKLVSPADINTLKRVCVSFAKGHEDARLGALCINFGFLTQSNVDLALEEQRRLAEQGEKVLLGDLLINAGMISERQRNLLLKKQKVDGIAHKVTLPGSCDQAGNVCKEGAEFDTTDMREIREAEFILLIADDGLSAYITKTDIFDDTIAAADFKFLLEKNGIIYGLIDDDGIETFIRESKYEETFFKIAQGLAPVDSEDARVVCKFEKNYLKPGELSKDGTIDFKERGEIPFVKAGDVIAEKIPAKAGKDGVNVYGDVIPKTEAGDLPFKAGKNVSISEDGLKAVAQAEGNPKIKPNGEISVNDAYFIEGDVDYTTGHIKFDKNVFITGTIKSGFRVEAIDVVAKTIDGGTVKAQGDVFIQSGVTDSSIESKGDIKAGFMHRSSAACLGNMTVVKEIVDTEILLEGKFDMYKGQMFSSHVCAKGGVRVYAIGSEKSKPSTVTVGSSLYMETELKTIDAAIEKRQSLLEGRTEDKTKSDSELTIIQEKLINFEKSRNRTLAMIEELKKNGGNETDTKIELFKKSLDEADHKTLTLQNQKTALEAKAKKTDRDIETLTASLRSSVEEKLSLKELSQSNPPRPILDVQGKIMAGTKVSGRVANLVLREDLVRARIIESNSSMDGSAKKGWEMIVSRL